MEEKIETRVAPDRIWQAWESAYAKQGGGSITAGRRKTETSKGKGFTYEVFDVVKGERFSVIWKTLFVRLIFSHAIVPKKRGSEIRYSIQIRGFLAVPVRWLLGNKIRYNVSRLLKTLVKRLEDEF